MSEEETYNRIQDYLTGALSKPEQLAFEQSLANDPELTKQFKLHTLANELVIERRLLEVNTILLDQRKKGGNTNTRILLSTAVILVGVIAFFILGNKKAHTSTPAVTIAATEQPTLNEKPKNAPHTSSDKNITPFIQIPLTNISSDSSIEIVSTGELHRELILPTPNQEIQILETHPKNPALSELSNSIEHNCDNILIDVTVSFTASCKDESNGSVSFTNIKGGTAPYTISLKNKQHSELSSMHVPAGNYTAVLHDKKGCIKTIDNIIVPEKICEKEYSFNPFMDETLNLPEQDQYGVLSIYERSGALYFTKELEPNSAVQWNGYSKNGELNPGYFIFVISDQDGKINKGGITIVR